MFLGCVGSGGRKDRGGILEEGRSSNPKGSQKSEKWETRGKIDMLNNSMVYDVGGLSQDQWTSLFLNNEFVYEKVRGHPRKGATPPIP